MGMNKNNGSTLKGIEHIRQSIADILTTPVGTRVMRREYGSRLFEYIDAPLDNSTIIGIISASAHAIKRWEPRLKVTRIIVNGIGVGTATLTLYGKILINGEDIVMEGLSI